jgi:hypothetical protein
MNRLVSVVQVADALLALFIDDFLRIRWMEATDFKDKSQNSNHPD